MANKTISQVEINGTTYDLLDANTLSALSDLGDEIRDEIEDAKKHLIVTIGDSWTQNANYWRNTYTSLYNDEIRNYAQGGVGFIGTTQDNSNKFSVQLNTAINDATLDKNKVTHVLVMGGINDYTYNYRDAGQFVSIIADMNASIEQNFPNATPIFVVGNMNYHDYSAGLFSDQTVDATNVHQIYVWHQVKHLCAENGINVSCMYGWITRKEYKSDLIHPAENGAGGNRIAANIHALIHGGTLAYGAFITGRSTSTINNRCQLMIKEDEVQLFNWCYVSQGAGIQYVTNPTSGFDGTEIPFNFIDTNNKGLSIPFKLSYPQGGTCALGISHNRFAFFPFAPNKTVPEDQAGTYIVNAVVPIRTDY